MQSHRLNNLIPIFFTILYLWLPTINSGIDAYAYAAAIKWGNELWWPHHLLYVPFGRLFFNFLSGISSIQPLELMQWVNAIAAGLTLKYLLEILKLNKVETPGIWVLFVGSCFGFSRFATENETYMLPILAGTIATFCFVKYVLHKNHLELVLSSLIFGLAILFHQIHVFWFLGLALIFVSKRGLNGKALMLFIIPASLLVLGTYLLVYYAINPFHDKDIIRFMLHDYISGSAGTSIGLANFYMTGISFIRTFFQIHGYILPLIKSYPVLWVVIGLIGVLCILAVKLNFSATIQKRKLENNLSKGVLWAIILHLAFAFFSVGNAEFMAMLPILIAIYLGLIYRFNNKALLVKGCILLFWNTTFALAPLHFLDMNGTVALAEKIHVNKNALWILAEPQKIENYYNYKFGADASSNLILKIELTDSVVFPLISNSGKAVFTDRLHSNELLNRGGLLGSEKNYDFKLLKTEPFDTIKRFGGNKVIDRILIK